MRGVAVISFLLLIFCCGPQAFAEKAPHAQHGSEFSATSHGDHTAPEITIEIIYNQAVSPFRTDAPEGAVQLKDHFLHPVVAATAKTLVRRLLPDVHAIVKLIIFPKHIFW